MVLMAVSALISWPVAICQPGDSWDALVVFYYGFVLATGVQVCEDVWRGWAGE